LHINLFTANIKMHENLSVRNVFELHNNII